MIIKKSKFPTILGIILLIIGTFLGVALVNNRQIFKLGASGEITPKDIRVSNISDSSLTISWITDVQTVGFIVWGTTENNLDKVEQENDQESFSHSITINGLNPRTNYFYKINSNGELFDNNKIPWQVTTGASLEVNRNSSLISGTVLTATGQPVKNALVYASVSGYLFSTLSSNTGNYVFQLGNARSSNLAEYLNIDPTQTLIEIFVQAGSSGISSAQIFPQSAKPAPPLILGQTHDFRSEPASNTGDVPGANLDLPENANEESKFSVPEGGQPSTTESVTLENIDEGEAVTSTQPEFFGEGPTGVTITIKVESENPITEDVKVSNNGSWSWSPPEDLAAGLHKITITWKDINGITRSLTRNFVVQAGEAPAFEASGSGSVEDPTPTPTISASPKPTSTPKGSQTPLPTDIPETGSLTPTLLLSMMGIGIFISSLLLFRNTLDA